MVSFARGFAPAMRWAAMPFSALAVLTSAKSFRDNPVIGSPKLNGHGLHVVRRRIAARMGALRKRQLRAPVPIADVAAIERDGFVVKEGFLDEATFRAFSDEIFGLTARAREAVIGDVLTRLIPLSEEVLRGLPVTRGVLEGPAFRALLDYTGSFRRRPHFYVQTIFSNYREAEPDIQSFYHSDTFHPTLKAWFYLNDVADEDAPLAYVPGSHRVTPRRLAIERRMSLSAREAGDRLTSEGSFRFSEAQIRQLGYGPPRRLPVPANTLIVADTSGIHRRSPTDLRSARVSIWAYSRSNPFLPFPGGDFVGLPFIRRHALRLYWAIADRTTGKRPASLGWRWVGLRAPLSPPTEA